MIMIITMKKETIKNIIYTLIFLAIIIYVGFLLFSNFEKIQCKIASSQDGTCYCGNSIGENNFKNVEFGTIVFYENTPYCRLKQMELRIDE